MTDTDTLEELRALHRSGTRETTLGLAALFEVMARGTYAETTPGRRAPRDQWKYDRHPGCGSCGCPIRSAGACGGPWCEITILSVHPEPPPYCSKRCQSRAGQQRRDRTDIALVGLLQEHPAGLEETEAARLLGIDTGKLRDAEHRVNREALRVARSKRTDVRAFNGYCWHLALAG